MNANAYGKIAPMQSPKTAPLGSGVAVLVHDVFFRFVREERKTAVCLGERVRWLSREVGKVGSSRFIRTTEKQHTKFKKL
jgi:hypothetical protein